MVFILITLLILGFFFPPAWLALGGYAIYIFASKNSRRDDAVEKRLKRMVLENKNYAVFDELYFETSRSYAIAKGAIAPEKDVASAKIIINNRTYFATFMRDTQGGTVITLRDNAVFAKETEDFVKNVKQNLQGNVKNCGNNSNPIEEISALATSKDASKFVETYFEFCDSNDAISLENLNERPSWVNEEDKVKEFTSYMLNKSTQSGVAETYSFALSRNEDMLRLIFSCVAAAEEQGSNFLFQKQVATAIIYRGWEKLSKEKKELFMQTELTDKNMEVLSNL